MNKILLTIIALLLVTGSYSSVVAQNKRWLEMKGKPLIQFDWNCALPSSYPKTKLNRLVHLTLKWQSAGIKTWADRAFSFDLNGDGRPEYFVPLVCGATGNCTWGVFTLNPAKKLGVLNGQYIYVHKRAGHWPDMITYTNMSASDGILATYSFRKGQYNWLGDEYSVSFSAISTNDPLNFLKEAKVGCDSLGY